MIAPVRTGDTQDLVVLEKTAKGIQINLICQVLYVPLQGVYGS
ncbi:hypothetical protein ACFL27_22465 [candidate division CSSED10-310 bacterium]|uniref:Uncharacterized protein n=1 Tax=candidate division CSSED10-310 bacterium TaxID=2855610 RepID=A0ABV6Z3E6_UNCC1